MCCPSSPLKRLWKSTLVHYLQLGQWHLFKSKFSISCLKIFESVSCFWGFLWATGIWVISPNSILVPLTVLSTHLSEVISFHVLRQDAMFPALHFLFDILISSSFFLTCGYSVLAFLLWFLVVILAVGLIPLALLFPVTLMVRFRLTLHVLRSSSWCLPAPVQKGRLDFILWRFMRGSWNSTTRSEWLSWNCKPHFVSCRYFFELLW